MATERDRVALLSGIVFTACTSGSCSKHASFPQILPGPCSRALPKSVDEFGSYSIGLRRESPENLRTIGPPLRSATVVCHLGSMTPRNR